MGKNEFMTYAGSGVNVEEGEVVVRNLESLMRRTYDSNVIKGVAGFELMYQIGDLIFIAGADGVGTKLKVAIMANKFHTIGQDLVAMSVNDILRGGARPLFFLDYFATSKLNAFQHNQVMKGISDGCVKGGVVLLGGETAEMPGFYRKGEFDLAGFAVGMVHKNDLISGKTITSGMPILGIESSGLHSNGYSFVREIIFNRMKHKIDDYVEYLGCTISEELLKPTLIYTDPIMGLLSNYPKRIRGIAHNTGGGFPNKATQCLPKGLAAKIDIASWDKPKIFDYLRRACPIDDMEMLTTFNNGIGMILYVNNKPIANDMIDYLRSKHGLKSYIIGEVVQDKRPKSELKDKTLYVPGKA